MNLAAVAAELADLRGLVAAALPPLDFEDREALAALLPLLPVGERLLAAEIVALVQRAPGQRGALARAALAPYRDADGGCRRLGRLLQRCRGRPVGERYLVVHDLGGPALWYEARALAAMFLAQET